MAALAALLSALALAGTGVRAAEQPAGTGTSDAALDAGAGDGLLVPAALRRDDLLRAIWFMEDLASSYAQIAEDEANKHARAAWLVLAENYRSAAETLHRLLHDRRIVVTDLPPGEDAAVRHGLVLVDGTLDGAWRAIRLARVRQTGGDDWDLVSRLSTILLEQLGAFRSYEDWDWYARHLRQSGAVPSFVEVLDPALAAEIVRFGHLKDKFVLTLIRAESAPSPVMERLWRSRGELVTAEADGFLERYAVRFGRSSAGDFARAWREYAKSAVQAATAYGQVTFAAPSKPPEGGGGVPQDAPTAAGAADGLWPPLTALIEAVPERIKIHAPASSGPRQADPTPSAGEDEQVVGGEQAASDGQEKVSGEQAVSDSEQAASDGRESADGAEQVASDGRESASGGEQTASDGRERVSGGEQTASDGVSGGETASDGEQVAQWRDALSRQTFQANGLTIPIRDETALPSAMPPPLSEGELVSSASQQGDAAPRGSTAGGTGVGAPQPRKAGGPDPSAAQGPPSGLAWLEAAVERHRALIALLPIAILLVMLVLIIAWLWRSIRRQAEEPLVLTTAIEDDPIPETEAPRQAAGPVREPPAQPATATGPTSCGPEQPEPERPEQPAPERPNPIRQAHRSEARRFEAHRSEQSRSEPVAEPAAPTEDRSEPAPRPARAIVATVAEPQDEISVPALPEDDEEELGPQEMVTALRSGNRQRFELLFEQETGLSPRDAREILRNAKADELAIVSRAIGLDQLVFASMVIMVRRHYRGEDEVPAQQLSSALAAFTTLSREEARSRLDSWNIDADFTPVESQRDHGSTASYRH